MFIIFSPPFILTLYNFFFYYIHLLFNTSELEPIFITIIFLTNFVSIISFFVFYLYFENKRNILKTKKIYELRSGLDVKVYILFFAIELVMLHYLLFRVFGVIDYKLFFNNVLFFYLQSRSGTAWVYLLIYTIFYIILIDIYFNQFNKYKVLLFISMLIILSFTGGRSNIIIYFGFILFILHFYKGIKIKLRYLFLSFMLLLTLFIGSTINRAGSIEHYTSGLAISTDFNQVNMLNKAIDYIDDYGVPYFTSISDAFYMFVPRSVWPDKPKSTAETRLLYPDVAEHGFTNYTIGMYANTYLNLGDMAYVLLILFVLCLNYLYIKVIMCKKYNFISFLLIFWFINHLQFLRGGIINARILRVTIFLILAYGLYRTLMYFTRNKKRGL